MKNKWMNFIFGYVRMRIDGPYIERFLNRCIQNKVYIWNIKRVGQTRITCYISLEDVNKLRPLLRMTGCKVRFISRRGIPFILKRMVTRSGFVAGIVTFAAILLLLSNIVWNIEIKGATPKVENQLAQVVNEMGIKRGKFLFMLPNVEDIQKEVTDRVEGATWVGVRLNGTTFQFEVVEQVLPEEKERLNPRHLVAKKKAVIHDLFVEQGQTQVKPNDFVNVGDLLVSGFIGKEGKTEIVPAKAVVLGEIWYKSNVSISLKNEFETLTGEKKTHHYISIFNFDIPVWGFKKPEFAEYETFERKREFRLLKWTIPVQYKEREHFEKFRFEREYTEDEAIAVGKEMSRRELEDKLEDGSEILGEKVWQQTIENGKVNLTIHYKVIEDITSEQPIIQGD